MNAHMAPVLRVHDLVVTYSGVMRAVRGVDFSVAPGECLALVGESGSGKTSIARAVMGLLPASATAGGSIRINGEEIVGRSEAGLRAVRGKVAGYVGQDPFRSCDPLRTIGSHVAEAWRVHGEDVDEDLLMRRLDALGIAEPAGAMRAYPHQWSGGMLQRASIAAAAAHHPSLIVADEPTSALDADRADATLLALKAQGSAILLITHDMRLVERHADRVAICYAGRIVETGDARGIGLQPRHPYTAGLIEALPRRAGRLPQPMPGLAPRLSDPEHGCTFAPRCARAEASCHSQVPSLTEGIACHLPPAPQPSAAAAPASQAGPRNKARQTVLTVRALAKTYSGHVRAVRHADFSVAAGDILGIAGPSGCGKSTLLRLVSGVEKPDRGSVTIEPADGRHGRGGLVMPVFQNAMASLDARWPIWKSVAEPARAPHRPRLRQRDLRALAQAWLEEVGLGHVDPEARPGELSGGQCQRVSIARALAAKPALLVADEPTSALDASVSATILHLLARLAQQGTAIIIVSHDRDVLEALCDRVLEMRAGAIDERVALETVPA